MLGDILRLSNGNPGAATCVIGLIENENPVNSLVILDKIERCKILGTDLYVFWSDLCEKDYDKMAKLAGKVPDDVLKDACSRQDYSGRELVKNYL
jgi:hypothetical protein